MSRTMHLYEDNNQSEEAKLAETTSRPNKTLLVLILMEESTMTVPWSEMLFRTVQNRKMSLLQSLSLLLRHPVHTKCAKQERNTCGNQWARQKNYIIAH